MLDSYIQKLVKDLNLEGIDLSSDVAGVYAIPLGDGLSVNLSDIQGGIYLRCHFAPSPASDEEMFMTQAMLANMFGQGTRGSQLGLTIDGKTLTLTRAIDYNINYNDFKDVLEDFINVVDYWRDLAVNHK